MTVTISVFAGYPCSLGEIGKFGNHPGKGCLQRHLGQVDPAALHVILGIDQGNLCIFQIPEGGSSLLIERLLFFIFQFRDFQIHLFRFDPQIVHILLILQFDEDCPGFYTITQGIWFTGGRIDLKPVYPR